MMRYLSKPLFFVAVLVTSDAWAHAGHFPIATFASGLEHPWVGLDHALAAIAVGFWASAQGTGRRWRGPVVFVASMIVGALLGHSLGELPFVDLGIAGSLVLLGGLLLARERVSSAAALGAITGFAVLHGLAHGGEAPATGSWPSYLAGLATATMALHLLGLAIGRPIQRRVPHLWPLAGIAVAAVGAWMLAV
jgi:urease accessory protein